MQGGYLSAAWGDIVHSPNWLGKVVILALVGLIPVFGDIVLFGYLLGWGRDLAWGVRSPLPPKVFANSDGMMYLRGIFYMVIAFLFRLFLVGAILLWSGASGYGGVFEDFFGGGVFFPLSSGCGFVVVLAACLLSTAFIWVGAMRMSVYGRLSPGLQVNKIASMIRYDAGGLVRIMGMVALLALASLLIILTVATLLTGLSLLIAYLLAGGIGWQEHFGVFDRGAVAVVGFAAFGLAALCAAMGSAATVFVEMLVIRSLGYWMIQFRVPCWGGQDDPLPFQVDASCSSERAS